jgi:sulfur carrier protein ThiS adenylyltransferase
VQICINEIAVTIAEGQTLGETATRHRAGADVVILNGFPAPLDTPLAEGDQLFLITRGEIPSEQELEGLMAARHTPGVHQKLKQATVGIAGVGGLGSAVAVALARVGVGHLIIADFDVVEPSNLNRQHYFVDQLGQFKVDAMADNLRRINPYIRIDAHRQLITPDTVPTLFADCQVIVEAFDRANMKAMLVNTALATLPDSTVVAASGLAGFGSNNDIKTRKVAKRLYLVGDDISEAKPGSGLMAPRVGIAAHHQANQVVRILLGEEL